jgi:hypothetical protein
MSGMENWQSTSNATPGTMRCLVTHNTWIQSTHNGAELWIKAFSEPHDTGEDVKLPTCALALYTGSPSVISTAVWLPVDEFAPNKTACTIYT